ncbi:hypothetical protein QJS04_geneDACA003786 [Acorus gramineus]|uniref:Uncharacterized protein n=1 Tax=Acorus gramineus TaxID=55184 RepID=A0AAV9BGZ9_ACOGR|nr:hypothetical protein QJS04_geneDACA003786 [Acorus gramineus]
MITDVSLYALSWYCPSLSEVHVQDCHFISKNGIACVIIRRPMLRSISMCWKSLPRWADVRALQHLHIRNAILSDDILFLFARLPLKELCIQGPRLTPAGASISLALGYQRMCLPQ